MYFFKLPEFDKQILVLGRHIYNIRSRRESGGRKGDGEKGERMVGEERGCREMREGEQRRGRYEKEED